MALTGEEIRARLSAFAARWSVYEGSERSEAQTFLNDLFACYGTDRSDVAHFEHAQAGRFLDLIWPRVCLIEMKAPKEAKKLSKHRAQAMDYWRDAAEPEKNVPSPRWVVICAFRRLEIWEPGAYPKEPRLVLECTCRAPQQLCKVTAGPALHQGTGDDHVDRRRADPPPHRLERIVGRSTELELGGDPPQLVPRRTRDRAGGTDDRTA